jgi:two-component system, cell cycle sensor histidine kinase and response regulator CckA
MPRGRWSAGHFLQMLWYPVTDDEADRSPLAGTYTLLVVDDVGVVRKAAFHLLSEAGYRVFEAGSAAEALEVLLMSRQPVNLVIVDVVMPEVNGVDLVRLIYDQWPDMHVLFMSAYPAEVLVREGLEHPNVVFLAKPFTRDELLNKVATALHTAPKPNGEQSRSQRRIT